jgi:glycosyltransferase involved in cell wall biosynthesis
VHPAFDVRIFHKECKSLAAAGYDVTIISPHDHDEIKDGVRVVAIAKPRNRRERVSRTVRAVYRAALRVDADVYHFHDPELMPVGMLLKLKGKHVIYDVHESYRDIALSREWIPSLLRPVVSQVVRFAESALASQFDHIIAAVPAISESFPLHKTTVVHNFPEADFDVQGSAEPYKHRPAICVYAGGISLKRGAREMVEAVGIVPAEFECRLALAGNIEPALQVALRSVPGWARVDVLGWRSRQDVSLLLGRSRVGLCVLHPSPNHLHAFPIKLFEYMSAGLPVIASDFPLYREIVLDTQSGVVVNPQNSLEIAEAITWMLLHPNEAAQMGRNGQRAVAEKYNWATESSKLLAVYSKIRATKKGLISAATVIGA